jgi:hypothetical protein
LILSPLAGAANYTQNVIEQRYPSAIMCVYLADKKFTCLLAVPTLVKTLEFLGSDLRRGM